ncbi:phage/plasmid primase, P4 family [Variovorax sp. YR566]|uniref:phage/plasmid primase, P4 family n=1 Tax=Variovorax sp. YR566 TaxID=3450237 RepID=UPI003F7E05F1
MSGDLDSRVREVLSHIDPNCERAVWWQICAGVKNELGDAGFAAFDEWSAGGESYSPSATRSTWRSTNEMGGKTFASVVDIAKTDYQYVPKRGAFKKPTQAELEAREQKYAARMAVHEAERAHERAKAAVRAKELWAKAAARPAPADHPYLERKRIKPHVLRSGDWYKHIEGQEKTQKIENVLLVPIHDSERKLHSLEAITVDGDKLFLPGGAKKGHFCIIGTPRKDPETSQPVLVGTCGLPAVNLQKNDNKLVFVFAEGLATAISIHEATDHMVFCCLDLHNMVEVVRLKRQEHPADKVEFIIAADNDTETPGNPGMTRGTAAAMAYGARLAVPPPGDFNDMALAEGPQAVRDAIEAATVPTEPFVATTGPDDASTRPSSKESGKAAPWHIAEPGEATDAESSVATHGEADQGDKKGAASSAGATAAAAWMFRPVDMLPANLPRSADARDGSPRYFALTEKGNSYRLANARGHDLRYVTDLNEFLVWSEGRWIPDKGDRSVRAAIGRLPKAIREEATAHVYDGTPDDASYALKWAQKSEAASTIANTVTLLKDIDGLHVRFQDVDANPLLVGFDGGRQVVELRDGSQRKAQRADLVTRSLGVNAVGDASKATLWCNFLAEIFTNDVELIDYMQRWIGYSLTGCYTEQMFLFLHGAGANGKSALVKVLRALFGGYGAVVAAGTLMEQQRTGKEASPDVLGMAGARILLASEVAQNEAFDERFLKGWTGGDLQKARALHGKNVDFEPVGKLMIAGNHRPRIVGTDPAVWRRVRLVPFKRQFSEGERDPKLPDRLMAELPHIAAWAIAGCLEWRRRGLADTPRAVKIASADYAKEQDTLGEFLAERTDEGGESSTQELFSEYMRWAESCNIRPISRQAFGRKLGERGFTLRHTRVGSVAENISLRRGPL